MDFNIKVVVDFTFLNTFLHFEISQTYKKAATRFYMVSLYTLLSFLNAHNLHHHGTYAGPGNYPCTSLSTKQQFSKTAYHAKVSLQDKQLASPNYQEGQS